MDSEKLCQHPFEELERQNSGLWVCKCGAEGILTANPDSKLQFYLQYPKDNRANRRRTVREIMKTIKRAQKQQKKQ